MKTIDSFYVQIVLMIIFVVPETEREEQLLPLSNTSLFGVALQQFDALHPGSPLCQQQDTLFKKKNMKTFTRE